VATHTSTVHHLVAGSPDGVVGVAVKLCGRRPRPRPGVWLDGLILGDHAERPAVLAQTPLWVALLDLQLAQTRARRHLQRWKPAGFVLYSQTTLIFAHYSANVAGFNVDVVHLTGDG